MQLRMWRVCDDFQFSWGELNEAKNDGRAVKDF